MLPAELLQVPIFNTKQLQARGVAPSELRSAVAEGTLVRLKRGWFTHNKPDRPADQHRLRVLAELRDHRGMVASHHSGAALLRLPVHRPDWGRVHLMRTGPGPARNRSGVVVHQQVAEASALTASLVVAQTALLCPVSGLMALDHGLRTRVANLADFDRWAEALRGHAGHAPLRMVRRLADARRESPLESRTAFTFDCWGWRLEPQFEVPGTGFRADGRIRGTRVLVECDGLDKYAEVGASTREKLREDDIRSLQWEVVRVTTELLDDRVTLANRVRAAIDRAKLRFGAAT